MLPLRPAALFRSRWKALLWAAGILWLAYDVANGQSDGNDQGDAANLAQAL